MYLPKTYFIDIEVWNDLKEDILMVWSTRDKMQQLLVSGHEKGAKLIVTSSDRRPEAVLFKVVKKQSATLILIDGHKEFYVEPSEEKVKMIVRIHTNGKIDSLLLAHQPCCLSHPVLRQVENGKF